MAASKKKSGDLGLDLSADEERRTAALLKLKESGTVSEISEVFEVTAGEAFEQHYKLLTATNTPAAVRARVIRFHFDLIFRAKEMDITRRLEELELKVSQYALIKASEVDS